MHILRAIAKKPNYSAPLMKHLILSLSLIFAPAIALAWAPYEQQSFTQQMQDHQVDYHAQVGNEYDPAMVPLAYIESYDGEPSPNTEGPLDAD